MDLQANQGDFDPVLMRESIAALEAGMREDGRERTPERKAELFVEFYVRELELRRSEPRGTLAQIAVRLIRFLKAS